MPHVIQFLRQHQADRIEKARGVTAPKPAPEPAGISAAAEPVVADLPADAFPEEPVEAAEESADPDPIGTEIKIDAMSAPDAERRKPRKRR